MIALTKRQSEILALVTSSTQTMGRPPTYRELMQILGLSSPATLHKHIQNLIKNGHLKKSPRGWRTLKATKSQKSVPAVRKELAIIGGVSKGQKIELYAQASYFEIPQSLASTKSTLYGFIVKDLSFTALHILRGDLIVIEARQEPHSGEMILAHSKKTGAQIGRYLVTYSDRKLQSHIQEMDGQDQEASLSFEENDLHIQGVIVGLFRKYQSSESSSDSGSKSSNA